MSMIRFILFCGLILHIGVAIWNGFFGPSLGAEGDAAVFHEEALYFANNLGNFEYVTGWVYAYFLGILYRTFSDHIFFGSMISVFAWFLSSIYLLKTMKILNQNNINIIIVLLLFSIWPSSVLNTSVTLREAFQMLSINIILYSAVNIFWNNKNSWILLGVGMMLGSVLHGALLIFCGAMFFFIIYKFAQIRLKFSTTSRFLLTFIVGGAGLVIAYGLLGNIAYSVDDGLVAAVQTFNEGATSINARANYRDDIYFSGPLDLILFLPVAFFQYMLEPLPARIGSAADAALFLENVVRVGMLSWAIFVNFRLDKRNRPVHSFILLAYIGVSLIWSIGSVNWGTAARHHVPGLGLLLVAAFYSLRSRASENVSMHKSRLI